MKMMKPDLTSASAAWLHHHDGQTQDQLSRVALLERPQFYYVVASYQEYQLPAKANEYSPGTVMTAAAAAAGAIPVSAAITALPARQQVPEVQPSHTPPVTRPASASSSPCLPRSKKKKKKKQQQPQLQLQKPYQQECCSTLIVGFLALCRLVELSCHTTKKITDGEYWPLRDEITGTRFAEMLMGLKNCTADRAKQSAKRRCRDCVQSALALGLILEKNHCLKVTKTALPLIREMFPAFPCGDNDKFAGTPDVGALMAGASRRAIAAGIVVPENQSIMNRWGETAETHNNARLLKFPNGDVYEGECAFNNKRHGRGIYRYAADGSVYEGEWFGDQKHGHGVYRFSDNNDVYDGNWVADQKHGHGVEKLANGDSYEGGWVAGEMHGTGVQRWADGDVYDGTFVAGRRHGRGRWTYFNDGTCYDGEWAEDQKNGRGVEIFPNGGSYEDDWIAGKRCEKGRGVWKSSCKDKSPAFGQQQRDVAAASPAQLLQEELRDERAASDLQHALDAAENSELRLEIIKVTAENERLAFRNKQLEREEERRLKVERIAAAAMQENDDDDDDDTALLLVLQNKALRKVVAQVEEERENLFDVIDELLRRKKEQQAKIEEQEKTIQDFIQRVEAKSRHNEVEIPDAAETPSAATDNDFS